MPTIGQVKNTSCCPVCRTLPLKTLTSRLEKPLMEYLLNYNKEDLDPDNDQQFGECALYYLSRYIQRIWSGRAKFPTYPAYQGIRGSPLRYTCGGLDGLTVITDQNTSISQLQAPTGFRPVHSDPLHPLVIARLREWIEICDSKHEGCHVDGSPSLPTRVLDIQEVQTSSIIKLVETTDGQRGQYITLSHCWGTSNSLITTRDNLQDMKRGFQLESSPATFRDAFAVSRELGIRYIWIDSLCIIQGDAKDWETESSSMAGIYRDATLMLSASCAASDTEGFLKPRPSTHSTLKITSPSGTSAEVYIRAKEFARNSLEYGKKQTILPIDTRGWCLQETYLSRRQIKFLPNRILWSCQDAELDESSQDNFTGLAGTGAVFTTPNLFRDSVPRRHRTFNLMTPYQGWYRMITDYTKRNLTYVSDKLPALSGLASAVAQHGQGRFCAGVWWEDVAFGICWKKTSQLSKIEEYIAPSWSWASVNGPVEFIDAHELYLTQTKLTLMSSVILHDFDIRNHGINEYGQIESAWMKLEAPMASLERTDQDAFRIRGIENPAEQAELSFDLDGDSRGELNVVFLMRRLDNSQETQLIHMGIKDEVLGVKLFGLIVRATPEQSKVPGLHDGEQIHERVGFSRVLTSQSREGEFWGKTATSIVLI